MNWIMPLVMAGSVRAAESGMVVVLLMLAACSQAPVAGESAQKSPIPAPIAVVTNPPPLKVIEPKTETQAAAPAPPKVTDTVWKLKKGKLNGTAPGKIIAQTKDEKSGQITVTRCWKYENFAVIESKSSGEVGAGEINLRRGDKNLCAADFAGKVDNLNIIEGDFAGVAGDYLLIEGADTTEGPPQFQIFSVATGKEVFKSIHNQTEEFSLARRGHRTSLNFFTKISIKCALAEEGTECWQKVIAANPTKKPTAMPDCVSAFKKAKVKVEEDALVTIPAQIADLESPKVELIGGKATCAPVPQ